MKPDEFIRSFFDSIKGQLREATHGEDGKSTRYRDSVVVATWSNRLWDVELTNGGTEPIRRQYDPSIARSSESAANYFVDALRRAAGQEPFPRETVLVRYRSAGRPRTDTTPAGQTK